MPTISVRLRDPNHPSGQRIRAGFSFHEKPTTVDVTPVQFRAIEDDPYLKIEKNAKPLPQKPKKEDKKPTKVTKADIIQALEKSGLKAGEDFDPEAKIDDLKALLQSL